MSTSPLMPTYARADLSFSKGEGSWLLTEDGRRFLDFGSGIAVAGLGHAHPRLVAALKDQAERLWHTSNLYRIPEQERLAARLTEACFADRVFFCNSGTEAMEGCIKLARRYQFASGHPERYRIITMTGAFHGRTLASLAATGVAKYLEGFGPPVEGFDKVAFGNLNEARAAVTGETAAVIVEPVQGEGGIVPADPAFLRGLRAMCDEFGLLLIFDEVQCGMGRTGTLFAHQLSGVNPDVMALAKGLGGGFPIGAFLATEAAAAAMTPGTHGSTFGGNPLAAAVGNAVLDVVMEPGFLDGVLHKGERFRRGLDDLVARHPTVFKEARGQGLMLGLVCVPPNGDVSAALQRQEMLAVPAGGNVIRLLPPLTVSEAEIDEALARLDRAAVTLGNGAAA